MVVFVNTGRYLPVSSDVPTGSFDLRTVSILTSRTESRYLKLEGEEHSRDNG